MNIFSRVNKQPYILVLYMLCIVKALSNTSLYVNPFYDSVFSVLGYVCYGGFLLICLTHKYTVKIFLWLMICCIALAFTTFYSGNVFLLITVLAIMAAYKVNFNNCVKTVFCATIFAIGLIIIGNVLGIFPSVYNFKHGEDVIRNSLGFRHVNNCGLYFLTIIVDAIIIKYENWKKRYYLYFFVVILFLYVTCGSFTSIACSVLAICLLIIFRHFNIKLFYSRPVMILLFSIVPICFIMTYVAAVKYDESVLLQFLNLHLSDRLFLNYMYFKQTQLSMIGHQFELVNWYLDSAYAQMLLFSGVLPSVLYCILNILNLKKAFKNDDVGIVIAILTFAVYGLFETGAIFFWFNISLLYLFTNKAKGRIVE